MENNVTDKTSINEELHNGVLLSIVHYLLASGMSTSQIQKAFSTALESPSVRDKRLEWASIATPRLGDETVASAVLRIWHRTPRYLDDSASPIALRLYGRAPSVEAIVRMQGTSAKPKDVIRDLREVGLIRRIGSGRYLPIAEFATIGQLHSLSATHVGKAVVRLLGTALYNTRNRKPESRLIERTARVPDLDARHAKAFISFTHRQGEAYLKAIDDWLETRRVDRKYKVSTKRVGLGAGVHLFAYIGRERQDRLGITPSKPSSKSSRHSSSGVRPGNTRAVAPCTTSGVPA